MSVGRAGTLASAALAALLVSFTSACIEPPGVGKAADPASATEAPPPWGSATSNEEMARKVKLLEDFVDGKLDADGFQKRIEKEYGQLTGEQKERALASIAELLKGMPPSFKTGTRMPDGPDRDMLFARLYFAERRFVESAMILSRVLDANPVYPTARNLLARCFFFLGNRDRTIVELEYILAHPAQSKDQDEVLDALFLIGAAVNETPGMSRENLEKGKAAWEQYLKLAGENSPQAPQVKEGLVEIEAGLRGEGRLAQPLVPRAGPTMATDAPKNVMGGESSMRSSEPAPMGPGAPPPPDGAPPERRADKLPPDAPPFVRLVAEGQDALEIRDLATAEAKFREAMNLQPGSPEVLVGLGRVFVQSGRIPEALRAFGEAIKVAPGYMPAWHYNGMAHMMSGSPKDAVASWEHVLEKDPAYAKQFQLDRRIEVARRMAQ